MSFDPAILLESINVAAEISRKIIVPCVIIVQWIKLKESQNEVIFPLFMESCGKSMCYVGK